MKNRRGASLVELMVVVSLLTAVMAFVGRMMYGLFQAEQSSARDVLLDRRLSDVSIQFREDVHRARAGADKEPRAIERQRRAELIADRRVRARQRGRLLPCPAGLPVDVDGARPELIRRFADEDLAVTHQHRPAKPDEHRVGRRGQRHDLAASEREERDGENRGIQHRSQEVAHGRQCNIPS